MKTIDQAFIQQLHMLQSGQVYMCNFNEESLDSVLSGVSLHHLGLIFYLVCLRNMVFKKNDENLLE